MNVFGTLLVRLNDPLISNPHIMSWGAPLMIFYRPSSSIFHADWGPRSRVCARETLRSAPYQREWKFSGARVCRVTFKHIPQPLRSHSQGFGTLRQLLKITPFVRLNIA
jgi:hypothetical protein